MGVSREQIMASFCGFIQTTRPRVLPFWMAFRLTPFSFSVRVIAVLPCVCVPSICPYRACAAFVGSFSFVNASSKMWAIISESINWVFSDSKWCVRVRSFLSCW